MSKPGGLMIRSVMRITIGFALAGVLSGCALTGGNGVKFTNVSDTWLNVWFYVGTEQDDLIPPDPDAAPVDLVRQKSLQVEPGGSATYNARNDLVHVQVETVSPTWVPMGRDYWIELLTKPPVHIVANGREDRLEFKSFGGEVAIIPERERADRFTHLSAPRPVTLPPQEEQPPVTDASAPDAGWDE